LVNWIIAIIQPYRLDAVRDALSEVNVHGMTVSEVRGYGRQRGHTEIYRGAEYRINYIPKLKLEIAVATADTERVIEAIRGAAHTGRIGDGKIFVLDLKDAMRIRTAETGAAAL
jgi:nitrogen regulatory protein P-II 2